MSNTYGLLLISFKRCTDLLLALAGVSATCGIIKEESSYFLSQKCQGIIDDVGWCCRALQKKTS